MPFVCPKVLASEYHAELFRARSGRLFHSQGLRGWFLVRVAWSLVRNDMMLVWLLEFDQPSEHRGTGGVQLRSRGPGEIVSVYK